MTDLANESEKQTRIEIIRQALKDKAPVIYEELESDGRLQEFLEGREAEMMASYEEAKKQAWEDTMANFLSFADPFDSETSSPMG